MTLIMTLYADVTLTSTYFYTQPDIRLQLLDATASNNPVVLQIPKEKHLFRINAKSFQKKLQKMNITVILPQKKRYITFIKKSPLDTTELSEKIKHFYLQYYKGMRILSVTVWPYAYLESLPENYTFKINPKNIKKSSGTFQLIRPNQHTLLFNYRIDAVLHIPIATHKIKRGESLSTINTTFVARPFSMSKSLPLAASQLQYYSAKHTININDTISQRDVILTPLVKRHDEVNVQMKRGSLLIEFSAKSLSNGALNDIITLEKTDGKRITAKVVGPLRAEMP